ncbi:hypothetical protein A0J61_10938 [Choanephora cucurbitarum]|uniref:Uncharacterized protein n=1 Tax=Choanephora cucurbitarum TaxID=101091 RepID=A0A1C7N100_9FUNG|nr:hypothetical protein A0J61_10938 [Choanephora cucurbitarum]
MDKISSQKHNNNPVVNCFVKVAPNTLVNAVEVNNVGKRNRNNNSETTQEGVTHNASKRQTRQQFAPPVTLPSPGAATLPVIAPQGTTYMPMSHPIATTSGQPVGPPGGFVVQPQVTPVAPPLKTKKLRAPPRKLPVPKREIDTWEKLDSIMAPISFKDWMVNDKNARKQLKDGLRFLDARNPTRRKDKGKGKEATAGQVNLVEATTSDSDDYSTTETDSTKSTYDDTEDYTSDVYDSDDDTIYDYPYRKEALLQSSPFYVMGTIHDRQVQVVIDSGSAVSVISKSFAKTLGLTGVGERVPITTLDTTKKDQKRGNQKGDCEVTVAVPIRIGGKLRIEHMIMKDDSNRSKGDPIVLLGMTWLKQHVIKIHSKETIIEIPIKNGASSILIQGFLTDHFSDDTPKQVFSVSVQAPVKKNIKYQVELVDIESWAAGMSDEDPSVEVYHTILSSSNGSKDH